MRFAYPGYLGQIDKRGGRCNNLPTNNPIPTTPNNPPPCGQPLKGNTMHNQQTIELKDEERTRCEVWTRVMGYHRPVASFNTGKQGEFHERCHFDEQRAG